MPQTDAPVGTTILNDNPSTGDPAATGLIVAIILMVASIIGIAVIWGKKHFAK